MPVGSLARNISLAGSVVHVWRTKAATDWHRQQCVHMWQMWPLGLRMHLLANIQRTGSRRLGQSCMALCRSLRACTLPTGSRRSHEQVAQAAALGSSGLEGHLSANKPLCSCSSWCAQMVACFASFENKVGYQRKLALPKEAKCSHCRTFVLQSLLACLQGSEPSFGHSLVMLRACLVYTCLAISLLAFVIGLVLLIVSFPLRDRIQNELDSKVRTPVSRVSLFQQTLCTPQKLCMQDLRPPFLLCKRNGFEHKMLQRRQQLLHLASRLS